MNELLRLNIGLKHSFRLFETRVLGMKVEGMAEAWWSDSIHGVGRKLIHVLNRVVPKKDWKLGAAFYLQIGSVRLPKFYFDLEKDEVLQGRSKNIPGFCERFIPPIVSTYHKLYLTVSDMYI